MEKEEGEREDFAAKTKKRATLIRRVSKPRRKEKRKDKVEKNEVTRVHYSPILIILLESQNNHPCHIIATIFQLSKLTTSLN